MPTADVNGTTLHYEDHGAGRPLVLLHGWGTSGRVWDAQTADLSRDHRVITLDLRGCGRSARATTGYTIADATRDTLQFLQRLRLGAPVLIGSSIAGAFVLEAALAAPQRIGAVIPVDAGVHHFATATGMQQGDGHSPLRPTDGPRRHPGRLRPPLVPAGGGPGPDRHHGPPTPPLDPPDRPPGHRPGDLRPPPPPAPHPRAGPLPPRRTRHRSPPRDPAGVRRTHPGSRPHRDRGRGPHVPTGPPRTLQHGPARRPAHHRRAGPAWTGSRTGRTRGPDAR
ncbi:alpha/beta hydrolase fold protein [Streptomyces sp. C]|nr:alpha/beta hydrolase fold protein [Streptomyces sp. C]